MSDNYGARCKRCDIRSPDCCDMCTVCIAELEAQVAVLKEAARQYMDLKDSAPWEEYNTKRTALAALIQESEDELL